MYQPETAKSIPNNRAGFFGDHVLLFGKSPLPVTYLGEAVFATFYCSSSWESFLSGNHQASIFNVFLLNGGKRGFAPLFDEKQISLLTGCFRALNISSYSWLQSRHTLTRHVWFVGV
jgi:hypothetical protein